MRRKADRRRRTGSTDGRAGPGLRGTQQTDARYAWNAFWPASGPGNFSFGASMASTVVAINKSRNLPAPINIPLS